MFNKLGVMQGRLLPKYRGRYQAHPVGYWQTEFTIAQIMGLQLIEWILDFNEAAQNPIMHPAGLEAIKAWSDRTGVRVRTVCADYFMEAPLHDENSQNAAQSLRILIQLLKNAKQLGVTDIVIPCVDQSRLRTETDLIRFVHNIDPARDLAETLEINLALETDLPPEPFLALLNALNSLRFTVNYDTGNSAALGYDPVVELATYGERISDIHLKDRRQGGGPVELGAGAVNFERFFNALKTIDYHGPFIMQAFRDDEGVAVFRRQLEWIIPRLTQWIG